jgi:hypothetical protein
MMGKQISSKMAHWILQGRYNLLRIALKNILWAAENGEDAGDIVQEVAYLAKSALKETNNEQ